MLSIILCVRRSARMWTPVCQGPRYPSLRDSDPASSRDPSRPSCDGGHGHRSRPYIEMSLQSLYLSPFFTPTVTHRFEC